MAAAIVLSAASVWLHSVAALSAGALWRDEAAGVEVANLPTLSAMWNNMQYDSFPVLWLLIARTTGKLAGPMNDTALRCVGFAIGLGLIGMLWMYARSLTHCLPLVSLSLLALSPSVIIWGDSARAYGLAMLTVLLAGALMWRFVDRPAPVRFVLACLAAIAAVHTIFFNSVILFAFCAAGVAVCIRRKSLKHAGLVILIGVLAAASLLPYAEMLRGAATWRMLARIPEYSSLWLLIKLDEVLALGGRWMLFVWIQALALTLYGSWQSLRGDSESDDSPELNDVVVFSIVAITVGVVDYVIFMASLSYFPSPWYYLPLLALIAVSIDSSSGALIRTTSARTTRLGGILVLAACTLGPASKAVRMPLTNVDSIATRLHRIGRPGDVVLVDPWFAGVSFYRYYRGPAPWMIIPSIAIYSFHRYDLIKEMMKMPDQSAPVRSALDTAQKTLAAGGHVFVVGRPHLLPAGVTPTVLPPAPRPDGVWAEGDYRAAWSSMVTVFLQHHAGTLTRLPTGQAGGVTAYENLDLFVANGWRP